ncbi:MAG: DNA methyltransferase [Myxococcota bacterium]
MTERQEQRGRGAYYTNEDNVLKVIRPLFLDGLEAEFAEAGHDRERLSALHEKLGRLRFLEPACGQGNFLVVAYRRLRELETRVLGALHPHKQRVADAGALRRVHLDQFHGIEIDESAARAAKAALWRTDRRMNGKLAEAFGRVGARATPAAAPPIVHGNALTLDWREVLPPSDTCVILGNPPFVGKHYRTQEQTREMANLFRGVRGAGVLDYAAAWFFKAARYIQNTRVKCAFVSTSSITQGEQVGVLWNELLYKYGIKIHFAHRPFAWSGEAADKACVHVVIIGFAAHDTPRKLLYDYDTPRSAPRARQAKNINPYLADSPHGIIPATRTPICPVPLMHNGSPPVDGGHLLLTDKEKAALLAREPQADPYIKPLASAMEFLHGKNRWCLWLDGISPEQLKRMPRVSQRVTAVRRFRLASKKQATRKAADRATLFISARQPKTDFLLLPCYSSENRKYVPMDFRGRDFIVHDSCACLPNAALYHFGVLSSLMHAAWMRYMGGRLGNSCRYSVVLVYNTFPWPRPSAERKQAIEQHARAVLDTRARYPHGTLAELYHPLTMPPPLREAHHALDKAVDLAYRPRPFEDERARVGFLLELYRRYVEEAAGMASRPKPARP